MTTEADFVPGGLDDEPARVAVDDTRQKQIESLLSSINEAASSTRALYVSVVIFMLYVAITIGSTTDEQLLRDSAIAIPLLPSANVPASSFYALAPLITLALHLDLLLNLEGLASRMAKFRQLSETLPRAYEAQVRIRLSSFYSVQWCLSEPRSMTRTVTGMIVVITVAFCPLFVLLGLEYGFLPYHSSAISWLHRCAIFADAGLLALFWPRLLRARRFGADTGRSRWTRLPRAVRRLFDPIWLGVWSVLFICLFVLRLPEETLELVLFGAPDSRTCDGDQPLLSMASLRSPGNTVYCLGLPVHRSLRLQGLNLTDPPIPPEIIGALRGPTESDAISALAKVNGLNLTGRDLRFADFYGALLPKTILDHARLDKARFSHAILIDVSLLDVSALSAYFRGSSIMRSRLDGTFNRADFRDATITSSDIDGRWILANFERAHIHDVRFLGKAYSANFSYATVTASDFGPAELQGANFTTSDIRRSAFQYATLNATKFDGATIEASYLHSANFNSASFLHVRAPLSHISGMHGALCDVGDRRSFPAAARTDLTDVGTGDDGTLTDQERDRLHLVDASKTQTAFEECGLVRLSSAAYPEDITQDACNVARESAAAIRQTADEFAQLRSGGNACRFSSNDSDPQLQAQRAALLLAYLCAHDDRRHNTDIMTIISPERRVFARKVLRVAGDSRRCPGIRALTPFERESMSPSD